MYGKEDMLLQFAAAVAGVDTVRQGCGAAGAAADQQWCWCGAI
jgi:hypothetical protein